MKRIDRALALCLAVAAGPEATGASAQLPSTVQAPGGGPALPAKPIIGGCSRLIGMNIPAASIGRPTTGATVVDAVMIAAGGSGVNAIGDYCLVSGKIGPIDPKAPPIRFQVALPTAWNSKAVMKGGGGFDGMIYSVATGPVDTEGAVTPLGRGYAVFAGDGGNQQLSPAAAGLFMSNEEALRNWLGDALKKERDASIAVVEAAYGRKPTRSYFLGNSTGGREALQIAAMYPADWDGVVSSSPAAPVTTQILGYLAAARAFAAPGAYLSMAKRRLLFQAALAACDGLDGARDGLISDQKGCERAFDPASAKLDGAPVRCPNGVDAGDTCLSDAQLTALRKMNNRLPFNFHLVSGAKSFAGYNPYTTDLTQTVYGMGTTPIAYPITPFMGNFAYAASRFISYGVAGAPAFNVLTIDPSNPGRFAARFSSLSASDAAMFDMGGFAAKGGKIILAHGMEDLITPYRVTEDYYHALEDRLGDAKVASFLRFYLVPGWGHDRGGKSFRIQWDQLTALENWVEKGVDPKSDLVATDQAGVPGRARPLCAYPTWPKFRGGDVNSATSFACATQ